MKDVWVGGLEGSNWQVLHRALVPAGRETKKHQPVSLEAQLTAFLRSGGSGGAARLFILAFSHPAYCIAAALPAGRTVQESLQAWQDEAKLALRALEEQPENILLVNVSELQSSYATIADEIRLRAGLEAEWEQPFRFEPAALANFDFGKRFAEASPGAVNLFAELEASAHIPGGGPTEPSNEDVEQALVEMKRHQQEDDSDLQKLNGIITRVADADLQPRSGLRAIKRLADASTSEPVATIAQAAGSLMRLLSRQADAQSRLEKRLAITSDRGSLLQESLDTCRAELVELEQELTETRTRLDECLQSERHATVPMNKLSTNADKAPPALFEGAMNLAASELDRMERENRLIRQVLALLTDEVTADRAAPLPEHNPPQPQQQDATFKEVRPAGTGLARWIWLARSYVQLKRSGMFDPDWYARHYPDVAANNRDPLLHYLMHGGLEGRSPSRQFCSHTYLKYYPDVRRAQLNPLAHYLMSGRKEGRYLFPVVEEGEET